MRRLWGFGARGRLAAAGACWLLAVMWLPGSVAAASVTFGPGSATSTFGTGIVFTQPYGGATVKSASILITAPDGVGPDVAVGPVVAALQNPGPSSLTYTLDTSSGGPTPFSPVVGQFEVTLADGSVVDGPQIHVVYADDRFTWKTLTGKVIRLHYINASASFAQQMLNLADAGVARAAALFGVTETEPIDYYVYPSQAAFQEGLSQPETVGGTVEESIRICYATVEPGNTAYAQQVMPHEPTHVVFWDATINSYHKPPRWLNEGFAQYVSLGYDSGSRQLVSQAVRTGNLSSLLALTDFFPLDAARINLAYAEAVSAVDFMIRKYGQGPILKLIQAYKANDSDDEAFQAAFGVDVAGFNSAWLADNGVTPTKYGPQPAPTGPLPPGWNGSAGSTPQPGSTGAGNPGAPGTGGQQSPGGTDNTTVYLLAGVLALAGIVLIVTAIVMAGSANRRQAL